MKNDIAENLKEHIRCLEKINADISKLNLEKRTIMSNALEDGFSKTGINSVIKTRRAMRRRRQPSGRKADAIVEIYELAMRQDVPPLLEAMGESR